MYKQEYLDYYDQLIEPYCSEAKNALINFHENPKSLIDAIIDGFIWSKTRIGYDEWEMIYESIKNGEEKYLKKEKPTEKNCRSFFLSCVVDLMGDESLTKEEINRRVQILIDKLC